MKNFIPSELVKKAIKEFDTPLYFYVKDIFERQYRNLQKALRPIPHTICFAVKANSNLTILNRLSRLDCGFDIVSSGELHRVRAAGGDLTKVVFAGVGKTKEEIELGIASNILFFNVESAQELELIVNVAKNMSTCANVSLRVNPNISVNTHPYLATGLNESKFGIRIDDIVSLHQQFRNEKNLNFIGVDCHIGSQIADIAPYAMALQQLIDLASQLNQNQANIKYIDLGGGIAVNFNGLYQDLNLTEFGKTIHNYLKDTPYHLLVEPGKFLISESGFLVTKVLYTKKNGEFEFIITDAGMNDLMRPSLYQALHHMEVFNKEDLPRDKNYQIGGPVCESGCMFAKNYALPKVDANDILIIKDAGAYGFSMASNYNTRPRPAEILIENNQYLLIRKRETISDLLKLEELESLHQ